MKKNPATVMLCHVHTICLSCEQCFNVCPAGINIPQALVIYEEYQAGNKKTLENLEYMDSYHQPLDCIECGRCSAHCPQGIEAAKVIRKLAMIQACPNVQSSN